MGIPNLDCIKERTYLLNILGQTMFKEFERGYRFSKEHYKTLYNIVFMFVTLGEPADEIRSWLWTKKDLLNGKTPLEAIKDGESEQVLILALN